MQCYSVYLMNKEFIEDNTSDIFSSIQNCTVHNTNTVKHNCPLLNKEAATELVYPEPKLSNFPGKPRSAHLSQELCDSSHRQY